MKKIFLLFSVIMISIFLVACGADLLEEDFNALEINKNIAFNEEKGREHELTLPDKGENGSEISWKSSDEKVIKVETNVKAIVFHAKEDKEVTLTANLTLDGESKSKKFDIKVGKEPFDSIDNIFTEDGNVAIEIGTNLRILDRVIAHTKTGFYLGDRSRSIYVESDLNPNMGSQVNVSGKLKKTGNKIFIEANENSFITNESIIEVLAPEKVSMTTLLEKDNVKAMSYGTSFLIEEMVLYNEGDNYFVTSGSERMDVSMETIEFRLNALDGIVGNKLIDVLGVLHSYDENWEFVLIEFGYRGLSSSEKVDEIADWIERQYPKNRSLDGVTQVFVPTTHPIYGGEIEMNFTAASPIIDAEGKVWPSIDAHLDVRVGYTITLDSGEVLSALPNGEGDRLPMVFEISSNAKDVHEIINEEVYSEGKANWDKNGRYDYEGVLNVKGEVISKQETFLPLMMRSRYFVVIKDVEKDVFITLNGDKNSDFHARYEVGEIIYLGGLKLGINGYKPMLTEVVDSTILSKVETVEEPYEIKYTDITYDEFMNLDKQNVDVYNEFYNIKDVYMCSYAARTETKVATKNMTGSCNQSISESENMGILIADVDVDSELGTFGIGEEENGIYKATEISHVYANLKGMAGMVASGLIEEATGDTGANTYAKSQPSFMTIEPIEKSDKNDSERQSLLQNYYEQWYKGDKKSFYLPEHYADAEQRIDRFTFLFAEIYNTLEINLTCYGDTICGISNDNVPKVYETSTYLTGKMIEKVDYEGYEENGEKVVNSDGILLTPSGDIMYTEFSTKITVTIYSNADKTTVAETFEIDLGNKKIAPKPAEFGTGLTMPINELLIDAVFENKYKKQ